MRLIQSVARNRTVFMTAAADGKTGLAGLTLTIEASKDGGAFASITPTVTDRGNGWYNLALTSSHTDTIGDLAFHITGAAADPTDFNDEVFSPTQYFGYEDGAVWIDTVNGAAGTVSYVNGTIHNPVASIADALTIAAALKLHRIHVAPGSSITLAATLSAYELYGVNWTLALGGQSIAGSRIIGATVSGTATGAGAVLESCFIGTSTLPPCVMRNCYYTANITMGSAGDFSLFDCRNAKTAASEVIFTFVASGKLKLENCHGVFGFASGAATNTLEWHGGSGKATVKASCTGLIVLISGTIELVEAGTSTTVGDQSRYEETKPVGNVAGDVIGRILGTEFDPILGPGVWAYDHEGNPISGGGGGSLVGPGSTEVEIVTHDDDDNPIDGVAVWISTDEEGDDVIAGTLYSAGNGITKFMLDTDMVYWVHRQLSGFNFSPNPEMITLGTP